MAENRQDPQVEAEQEGQEGQPQPQPEAQQEEAQHYDIPYDPDLVRSQYEEVKRREREVERREREIQQRLRDSERQSRFPDPSMDMLDPVQRAVIDRLERMDRRLNEREEREEKEREEAQQIERVGQEAYSAFLASARNNGMTRDQAAKEWGAFTDLLTEHYPHHSMLSAVGVDRAVRNVLPLFKNGARSQQPQMTTTTRMSPRTPIVTAQGTGPMEDRLDVGPQRQGESNTDYAQRVLRNFEALGARGMGLKDGERLSSE